MKRRHSDQDVQSRSDASSNGFDTESDVGHSGASSAQNTRRVREKMLNHSVSPPHPPPPVKKKRTRTLTTPQQSAALHALLAQSRFPTTAMREQVGRSIGLSARKVQVWFQNQRQKARRPRDSKNQGSPAAPARPPQYGAFPNVPVAPFLHSSASSTVNPPSLPSDELYATTRSASAPFVHFNANRGQQQPATSSGRLSGPGVPGATSSPSSSFTAPPRFPHTPQRQQQPQTQTLAPLADPSPQARSTLTRDVHSISSTSSARQVMPSRDFTFNHPFPPLHLQVPETSGVLGAGQNQYPTMIPLRPLTASSHHSLVLSSNTSSGRPRSQYSSSSSSSSPRSPPSPFAPASASVSGSRPQTPVSSFLVPRHRDPPRLRIVPLHVPESPHTNTHANNAHAHASVQVHVHVQPQQPQRSALPRYSPPPLSLPPDPTRFSHSRPPSDRALPSLFHSSSSSTSRGGEISPVPAHASMSASASVSASSSSSSRARRFDPVREAASECSRSGSLGTDSSMSIGTPPRIDTPKRLTTSF